ncbi:DUF4381 domain-containing protein [Bradyrhizobium sp. 139]|uniref:DUF4381 domain-containing protein n=1 Tax=Bradyrhizobium sp. 139 TaxID=2782616 RepID=UPI001FFA2086|nr:DUF4381 domain-containing protein [Bradyrhizobium sp. 139]MCK1740483.1 DUF4381 domain-containing protein [Bradyrhizobium sp. 139]
MADAQPIDPVAGLIDIPLPGEVSLWPQTWESRIAIVLLLAVVIAAVWHLVQYRRVNRYRREALAELRSMAGTRRAGPDDLLTRLTLLVRRTALAAFPREQVASLAGPAWLSFLDRSYGGQEFSQGVGRLLVSGPYQQVQPDDAELQSLSGLVRRWIRGHHA